MATRFNGFSLAHQPIVVRDEPLMSMHNNTQIERRVAVGARA
jgi:hypothetical protein